MANIFEKIDEVAPEVTSLEILRQTNPTNFAGRRQKGVGYTGSANVVAKKAKARLQALADRLDKIVVN